MKDLTATHKFYEQIKGGSISFAEFEKLAKRYFRAQFKEVGGAGASITRRGWVAEDNRSPFFVLCSSIAVKVAEKHEFRPFYIELIGSSDGPEMAPLDLTFGAYYGLIIAYNACSARVLLYTDSTKVEVSYEWPEDYSEETADGVTSGGSHRSKDYAFDLAHPDGVKHITDCVLQVCELMLTQTSPLDSPLPI